MHFGEISPIKKRATIALRVGGISPLYKVGILSLPYRGDKVPLTLRHKVPFYS